jgi:hypothetical protein
VEEQWMHCGYADDINFLSSRTPQKLFNPEHSHHLRTFFRLISSLESIESLPHIDLTFINYVIVVIVHRFEETINGQAYLIEVSPVDANTWRARLARVSGKTSALMPFYGPTPNEAACHLRKWLRIAHGESINSI